MKRMTWLGLSALAGLAALTVSAQADGLMPPEDVHVVVVTHGSSSDAYWSVVKRGVDDAAELTGAQVDYYAPQVFDVVEQARLIEAAVATQPDGLAVSIPDADALRGPIEAAVASGIPVIEDMVLKAGALRGDVTGGATGEDYYHFGDYLEVRYYPVDWLYVRYLGGVQTFDNREGLYEDEDRFTSDDGSSHSVGIVYIRGGFRAGVYHYWRLEKVDEQDNDFLRVRLSYDF